MLLFDVVLVACTRGIHRSVAAAELARQALSQHDTTTDIDLFHLELAECPPDVWNRVCDFRVARQR